MEKLKCSTINGKKNKSLSKNKKKKKKKKKPSKNHRSKIQILHRKDQPDETRMQLSYAILSAATLVSNTQKDSIIMVILTCQPQSSGCEKVEQKPLLFKKKNSNRNRAPSSKKHEQKNPHWSGICCHQKRARKRAAQSETTTTLRRETERKMKIMNRSDRRCKIHDLYHRTPQKKPKTTTSKISFFSENWKNS